jgi:nucleotide-binding universal stress UspA family protein
MYDRILVPTDGSPSAEAAMDNALVLAESFDAELRLLYVIDTRRYDTSIGSAVDPLEREAERCLDRLVAATGETDAPITTDIELGRPARTILSSVDAHDVDLVVMGTRGEGGLPRRLLGSVTEYVVTHADVPIHVVPSVGDADDSHEGP